MTYSQVQSWDFGASLLPQESQMPFGQNQQRAQLQYPMDAESEGALRKALENVIPQMIARNKVQQDAYISNIDGATITFNIDQANLHTVTLGGNRTLAVRGGKVGQVFVIRLLQDGSGSRTVTWFTTLIWAGAAAPTLTTTANRADTFVFIITSITTTSTNLTPVTTYDGYVVGQNIG